MKIDTLTVNFRKAEERCFDCKHWLHKPLSEDECKKLHITVSPKHTCDLWEIKN
jgi:hypothetical protein